MLFQGFSTQNSRKSEWQYKIKQIFVFRYLKLCLYNLHDRKPAGWNDKRKKGECICVLVFNVLWCQEYTEDRHNEIPISAGLKCLWPDDRLIHTVMGNIWMRCAFEFRCAFVIGLHVGKKTCISMFCVRIQTINFLLHAELSRVRSVKKLYTYIYVKGCNYEQWKTAVCQKFVFISYAILGSFTEWGVD